MGNAIINQFRFVTMYWNKKTWVNLFIKVECYSVSLIFQTRKLFASLNRFNLSFFFCSSSALSYIIESLELKLNLFARLFFKSFWLKLLIPNRADRSFSFWSMLTWDISLSGKTSDVFFISAENLCILCCFFTSELVAVPNRWDLAKILSFIGKIYKNAIFLDSN